MPGSSTTAATRTRRTRPISYYAKGSLVALALRPDACAAKAAARSTTSCAGSGQTSGGGPIDEADIAAALEAVGGRSFAARARGLGARHRRAAAAGAAAALRRRASSAQPATLAQRLGVRVSESALTGVKVTHVLRGGAGERAGLAAGRRADRPSTAGACAASTTRCAVDARRPARRRCCIAATSAC